MESADGIRPEDLVAKDRRITPQQVMDAMTLIPIDSIRRHPANNNVGDEEAIGESIGEFGFFDPIVVQKSTGHIITGNHSWDVYRRRGATEVPALVYDIDDLTAKRMMLAHNRTNRRGHDDMEATLALLRAIEDEAGTPHAFQGTGWTLDDMDDLAAQLDKLPVLPPPPPEEIQAHYAETDDEVEERTTHLAGRGAGSPTALGMREVILVLPVAEHADLMADLAMLKKHFPGEYPTGRLGGAAVAMLAAARRTGDEVHPPRCPCADCKDPAAAPARAAEPPAEDPAPQIPHQAASPDQAEPDPAEPDDAPEPDGQDDDADDADDAEEDDDQDDGGH